MLIIGIYLAIDAWRIVRADRAAQPEGAPS